MKGRYFLGILFALIVLLTIKGPPVHAQKPAKTLTFLYSNNINGEIDPCPT